MSDGIHSEDLSSIFLESNSRAVARDVLTGEIDGMRTLVHSIVPHQTIRTQSCENNGRVYFFFSGKGTIDDGTYAYEIKEIAFFAPCHNVPFSISTSNTSLQFLELIIDLSQTDLTELKDSAPKFPIFLSYSDCKTYKEKIKSEKTVSRTLLPEYTFPRLCMGSVETTGDDRVGAHKHPMLEQLFFGLKDNDCIVKADDAEMEFKEGVLLHIPLGSNHGVDVKEPKRLHYIWIDLFRDRKGMDWITQEHIPDE